MVTNSPPSVEAEIGDRTVTRALEPSTEDDSGDDPWDGRRFIARSYLSTEPVALTYAHARSSNAAGFVWRGNRDDTVLEWSVSGGGPCFVKDGKEVSTVAYDVSVAVLPRGTVSNFKIRAKARTRSGTIITRQTELRVIRIVAEPVMSFDPGAPVNPCGLFVNGSAKFKVEFSSNVRAEDVRWSVANGNAALAFAPQSTAPQTVVGIAPGTETLTAEIAHYAGPPPHFNFEVYAPADPIPVHFMFICDNSGNHAGSASDIPSLIAGVNHIYRQAGIRFAQASVAYTNEIFWYLNSDMPVYQKEIVNAMTGTKGLEAYIVPNIATNVAGKNLFNEGLLMTNTVSAHILAHEIGHQCGWEDIYTAVSNQPPLTMPLSKSHLSHADWNNGPGPQEYYQRGLPLATVIRRCLMFGYTSGGYDIPAGPIKGYDKKGVFGPVRVGTQGMDRFPKHKE